LSGIRVLEIAAGSGIFPGALSVVPRSGFILDLGLRLRPGDPLLARFTDWRTFLLE